MAHRLRVSDPQDPYLYNVSFHVGPGKPNHTDDVMLVQFFISETLKVKNDLRMQSPAPPVNGVFDVTTGFWMFEIQYSMTQHGVGTVDGVASPARGWYYGGGKLWLISALNLKYKQNFPENYDKLHEDQRLSPSLRASIRP